MYCTKYQEFILEKCWCGILFKRTPLLQEHWAIKEELEGQRRAQTHTAGPGPAPHGDVRGQ